MQKILLSWSSGKDSALALHVLRASGELEVAALLTTLTEPYNRVSMHGVRRELLEAQAAALGLPLEPVWIRPGASNADYETQLHAALAGWRARGTAAVAFGDLFLEDVRRYREDSLARAGLAALFPLWGRPTHALAREMLRLGLRAVVTCVDTQALDGSFAGREYDEAFLADLPAGVDPCGENGEFHTFVYAGPEFSQVVAFRLGERVLREERFMYADLLPA